MSRNHSLSVVFDGTNFEEFQLCFVARALTYGAAGKRILRKLHLIVPDSIDYENVDDSLDKRLQNHEDGPSDGIDPVIASLFEVVTGSLSEVIQKKINADKNLLLKSDIIGLYDMLKTMAEENSFRMHERAREVTGFTYRRYFWNFAKKLKLLIPSRRIVISDQNDDDFTRSIINSKERNQDKMKYYSVVDGIISTFSGDYVQSSWESNQNGEDLQGDIIGLQSNLTIVGALVLAFAFPMFTTIKIPEQSNAGQSSTQALNITAMQTTNSSTAQPTMTPTATPADDFNYTYMYIYASCVAICIVMESVCVLLAVRNVLAISLLRAENVPKFVQLAATPLMVPVWANFVAMVAMVGAIILIGLNLVGPYPVAAFCVIIITPMILVFAYYIGRGIQALWVVQPWYKTKDERTTAGFTSTADQCEVTPLNPNQDIQSCQSIGSTTHTSGPMQIERKPSAPDNSVQSMDQ